jgi:3-carboxy-cis,cis-muconate cycloisomerase
VVNADRMRSNLDLTGGLIYAEAVAFALAGKLDRRRAQQLVEEACRRARAERRHLREVLSSDPELAAVLDANSLDRLFEPANYLGSGETFIDAVLAARNSQPESVSKLTVTG